MRRWVKLRCFGTHRRILRVLVHRSTHRCKRQKNNIPYGLVWKTNSANLRPVVETNAHYVSRGKRQQEYDSSWCVDQSESFLRKAIRSLWWCKTEGSLPERKTSEWWQWRNQLRLMLRPTWRRRQTGITVRGFQPAASVSKEGAGDEDQARMPL